MPTLWKRRPAGLIVVAIVVALFSPTLVFGRVDYDDMWLWGDDSPLRQPSVSLLHVVFFELDADARRPLGTEYLPVRDLFVALDMAIWGENEHGPHLTQLALYALCVLGMGALLVGFGLPRNIAWLGTLFWAIHPSHVETVAWLSERKGVLAGLFVVGCGHAWLRYRGGGSRSWLALAVLAAVAGVWSKAPAMFGPAVLAVWDFLLLSRGRRRWIAIGLVGAATLLAAIPVLVVAHDGGIITESAPVELDRLTSTLGAKGHYLQTLLLAKPPSISYGLQTGGPSMIDLVIGVIAVFASAAVLAIRRDESRRWRQALVCWAWVWFLPISHLIAPVHIPVADRYAYLWTLAGCVGVAWAIQRTKPPLQLVLSGAAVCVLGVCTIRAEEAWTSTIELYAKAFATNPRDTKACQNYAIELVGEANRERAISVLDRCLTEQPNEPYLLEVKARIYEGLGEREHALELSATAALSGRASSMWNHALRLARANREEQAVFWAARAARRRPEFTGYMQTYAEFLLAAGRPFEAEMIARVVLLCAPTPAHHLLVAQTLLAQGRQLTAEPHLARAAAVRSLVPLVEQLRSAH